MSSQTLLTSFVDEAYGRNPMEAISADLIGKDVCIPGPFGPKRMIYADYAASGRALNKVETFIQEEVLAFYANAHTEASYCGAFINKLRKEARHEIAKLTNASEDYAIIFTGSGATSGINRLFHLLIEKDRESNARRPLVILGPYEHHSNILPWREADVDITEIGEAEEGGPDFSHLKSVLSANRNRQIIGAFSAASNVTGIITDVEKLNALLKRYNALSVFDYAGAAPYLPINMQAGGGIDAVVFSPHKFPGGPGASGILIVKKSVVRTTKPTVPGGGTVAFVSPWAHYYTQDLTAREEAGTPNVIGDIRASLALMIKAQIGDQAIAEREHALQEKALTVWRRCERLELLGHSTAARLPIFSFRVADPNRGYIHHQLITRLLSDRYGIQARGGCACAGPYAHRLLEISQDRSGALWQDLDAGDELQKPGWCRLNFSYLMSDADAEHVIKAVADLSECAPNYADAYRADRRTARFQFVDASTLGSANFGEL